MKDKFISILKQEVVPALGCTEPIAVSLATARSCEALRSAGFEPETYSVAVSANILKNGMGVGIPGTGMVGLHIAVALASVCGKSSYRLEVLKDLDAAAVESAKQIVDDGKVSIRLADTDELLYVEACALAGEHVAKSIISGSHDSIREVTLDGASVMQAQNGAVCEESAPEPGHDADFAKTMTVRQILDFVQTTPLDELEFMMDSVKLNRRLSEEGLSHKYGLQVGRGIVRNAAIYGDTVLASAMSMTAAASDARMAGCTLPAMSNSGSGNQGITVTVPVISVAESIGASHEQLVRALALSHLVAIHIKGHLGRLSALCGCVVASTGSSCGIVYLRGGGYESICAAIKNMVGNITGMVCDGAKEGCAMKVASGVASSIQSAVLALDGICISSHDGIIDDDIEKTIANLGQIGSVGMKNTDRMILDIMVCK